MTHRFLRRAQNIGIQPGRESKVCRQSIGRFKKFATFTFLIRIISVTYRNALSILNIACVNVKSERLPCVPSSPGASRERFRLWSEIAREIARCSPSSGIGRAIAMKPQAASRG